MTTTMRILQIVAILLIATVAASGSLRAAQSPAPAELDRTVQRLLPQLDADSREVRVAAERELLRLGPDVLPFLPPPELLPTTSVREAVRRIRIELEERKARESVRASRITLKGTLPLERVLAVVSQQSGNRIDETGLSDETLEQLVDVNYANREFWPVVDDLLARLSLAFRISDDGTALVVYKPEESPPRVRYSGAFRVEIEPGRRRPIFGDATHELLRIPLGVTAEPRLRPLFMKYAARDFQAQTASGMVLPPFDPAAERELPLGGGSPQIETQIDFRIPAEEAVEAVAFQGRLVVQTAAGTERIVFTNLPDSVGAARRRGGVTVSLADVSFRSGEGDRREARIRVLVRYGFGGPAFESHRSWILHNRAWLEVDGGRRIDFAGDVRTVLQADGVVAVEYTFPGLTKHPQEYRLVYEVPTLIINVPVEFSVVDLEVSPSDRARKSQ